MSIAEDGCRVARVRKSTLIEMDLEDAPVLSLQHFAPMIPDKIQVEVDSSGTVAKLDAWGVVASKSDGRTKRPTKVFCFWEAYEKEVPDWLKKLVADAIEN